MDWVWWTSNSVSIIMNTTGIVANSFLLFMVLKKTPKHLISYSVLIFDTALCDLVACIGAIFMLLRVVSFGPNSYNFYYGPCRLFGPGICMIVQGLILSCHHHGIHSLLVSFAYRYYVLVRNPPRVYKVAATVILVYLPTFFVFVIAFVLSGEDQARVKADIEKNLGHNMSSECFSSEKEWGMTLSSYYLMLPPLPIYITILILRRLIMSKITIQTTMSERTQQLHKQLLRALAIQACLPVLYLGGIVVNMVGLLNIYNHPIMEYAFVYLFVPIPAINPLVSLYFVGPYRVWIRDKFFKSKQSTAKETAVTTVTALQQNGIVAPMQPQLLHS
uniref:G_PROTEIN_RECEP_F1_2 domain-containing protein n=1 Tax=Haemonchus contortus TaxID=6289 RepID=A0A7I4YBI3_HAECO